MDISKYSYLGGGNPCNSQYLSRKRKHTIRFRIYGRVPSISLQVSLDITKYSYLGDSTPVTTVELSTRRREMRRDGANHDEKLGLREFCGQVNLPSPMWQVQVPIGHVVTPIRGLSNPIRQVAPLISNIRSYAPHCSHHHPPSLSFSSITLASSQNTKLSHPSLSLHLMIMSRHQVQHTPSTAYIKYIIHQVKRLPKIVCLPFILMIMS